MIDQNVARVPLNPVPRRHLQIGPPYLWIERHRQWLSKGLWAGTVVKRREHLCCNQVSEHYALVPPCEIAKVRTDVCQPIQWNLTSAPLSQPRKLALSVSDV